MGNAQCYRAARLPQRQCGTAKEQFQAGSSAVTGGPGEQFQVGSYTVTGAVTRGFHCCLPWPSICSSASPGSTSIYTKAQSHLRLACQASLGLLCHAIGELPIVLLKT